MPLLKISRTHSEGQTHLSCELHYGSGESERTVSFQTSIPAPDAHLPEDQFYKREIAAMADALAKARIRVARAS